AYLPFVLSDLVDRRIPPGQPIRGSHGEMLYGFYEPVNLSLEIRRGASNHVSPERKIVGVVRMVMRTTTIDSAVRKLVTLCVAAIVLALLIGLGSAYLLTSFTAAPVIRVAEAASILARGDLKQQVQAMSKDELGVLAQSFNSMAENLAKMIRRIRDAYLRMDQGREQIQSSTLQVLEGSRSQVLSLEEISSAITEMNFSAQGVAESVENLSASSEQTSASIMEMAASIEQVTGHIKSLSRSVDDTSSSITEMVSSIQQVDSNIDVLSNLISDSTGSMKEMEISIRQVEENAADSRRLSEQVTADAEMGMRSVQLTMAGMERIRSTVLKARDEVAKLGSSSEEIGKILNVIDDIAEQTNLLALNAAIIAAQAGEQGKGFAVVAEEIRELAERTAVSTKEIDTLIKAVQRDVANAVQTMLSGSQNVQEGVHLSNQAGESLKKILDSARASAGMAKEIAQVTVEQSAGIQSVNQVTDRVREMMIEINKATGEQKLVSRQIILSVQNMREMTTYVQRAMEEQSKGSKQITAAIENVTQMVNHILKATADQAQGSQQIVKIVEFFKEINQKNLYSIGEMDRALSLLLEQTGILKQEISIFKV
ncbi:MAG TPA: methyl-accepting chemotaxis protein, partial [Acidobacteriota bacterium]|nr:methyl-accepting chemotaxis protein [Acidobacteriota bacterium]